MESLPTDLLASSLSYLDYGHAVRMASVSRRFRASILPVAPAGGRASAAAQDFWRSLCKSTFRMDDARFREWPNVACWFDMYRILNEWGRREGFYTLDQASPWGMLCLFHLEAGKFVGEALVPCSFVGGRSRRWEGDREEGGNCRSDGLFDREVFFEAEFCEGGVLGEGTVCGGDNTCQFFSEDSPGGEPLRIVSMAYDIFGAGSPFHMMSRPSREENIVFLESSHTPVRQTDSPLFHRQSDPFNTRNLPILRTLFTLVQDHEMHQDSWRDRLEELAVNNQLGGASSDDAERIFQLWRAQNHTMDTILGADIIESMWNVFYIEDFQRLTSLTPKMLNFQYVDGPSHELSKDIRMLDSMPVIRPGLYCGSYHPELYGKYCNEILLVEYRSYAAVHLDDTWDCIHAEVFNSQSSNDMMAKIRNQVDDTGNSEVVFVVGRKVTGDMNVPAGKSSFGALVHPLLPNPNPDLPEIEHARSRDGEEETLLRVVRQWHGFATTAYPVFQRPSTRPGILVQLENDPQGNHQFGFLWDRSSHETIVLKWLPIQDRYRWFHRSI